MPDKSETRWPDCLWKADLMALPRFPVGLSTHSRPMPRSALSAFLLKTLVIQCAHSLLHAYFFHFSVIRLTDQLNNLPANSNNKRKLIK